MSAPRPMAGSPFRPGVPRPIYREPSPVSTGSVLVGAGATVVWMLLFGVLARTGGAYVWWTIAAGIGALGASAVLVRRGDRGVGAGVAGVAGLGVAIAFLVVVLKFANGDWILW